MNWIRWQLNRLRKWYLGWRIWRRLDGKVVETYHVPLADDGRYLYKRTKAYADERQKMPHNRRRKPSKAMRNLYQLKKGQ